MSKITGEETIKEIIEKNPQAKEVINKYFKSMCFSCPMAGLETLADGAKAHGQDLGEIIKKLNSLT